MRVAEIGNRLLKKKWFQLLFFAVCFIVLFAKSDRQFGWTNPESRRAYPINSDGSGYYAYLPQWFTFHTDRFQFADTLCKTYYKTRFIEFTGDTSFGDEGHYNKYYPGTAICLTPFYLAGQVHVSFSGHRNDGYSWPFLLWCNIGLICFALFGGYALFRLANSYKLAPFVSYLLVVSVLFGTNLCYYTTVEIPFSHVFCFAVNTWILLLGRIWSTSNKRSHFYILCFLLGFTLIIRPTNAFVFLAIPFLFPSLRDFWTRLTYLFRSSKVQLLIGFLLGAVSIAFLYWNAYCQTGALILNSYSHETFDNWKDPYIFDVLFSYQKGLFVYTPILFLLLPALVVSYVKERQLFWMNLILFAIITYSTASWWMWHFGGGFGARTYIDFMAVFLLAIGVMINHAYLMFKLLLSGAVVFSIWLYQIYDYQMRYFILHYLDNPKERFWEVFMKDDHRFQWYMITKFDELPQNVDWIGGQIWLPDSTGNPIRNRVLELNQQTFRDDPQLKLQSEKLSVTDKKIGMSFHTDVRIYDHFTSPSVNLFVYLKGQLVEDRVVLSGAKIPNMDEFTSPKLYLNLETKWSEIDSVVVWFGQGEGKVAVKNQYVKFYAY